MNEERNKTGATAGQHQQQQNPGRDKGQQSGQQPGSSNRDQGGQGSATNTAPARPGSQDKSKKDDGSCGCDEGGMAGKNAASSKQGAKQSEE